MNNISFDRPWLLLVGFVIMALIVTSFVLTINKNNRSKQNVTSFIIHIVMVILITLSLAGTKYEKVITETNVYVLADVSYSSNNNLDLIDQHIKKLQEEMPRNSKMGIICFGKDYQLLVKPGEEIKSVKEAIVDNSQTNIVSALEYASTLFKPDVIKRIVIISDGKETEKSNIATLVQSMSLDNIYVDAVYLDNNVNENINEVQISNVEYANSTYVDTYQEAFILLQSSTACRGYLDVYLDDELLETKTITLTSGNNIETLELDTKEEGVHRYQLVVRIDGDISSYNNSYQFSYEVVKKINILAISSNNEDLDKIKELYEDQADIKFYNEAAEIPYTVEELVAYDEFIISDFDVRTMPQALKFIESLDILVSEFGKSLTTYGNTFIQNNYDNEILASFSDLLPVKFGIGDQEDKLLTIVLDISRSMDEASKFHIAKECIYEIVDKLGDNVQVMIYVFYGKNYMAIEPMPAINREEIKEKVNNLEAYQGTMMGGALKEVYQKIISLAYSQNEMILISDGLPYGSSDEEKQIELYANKLALSNVTVSTIHVVTPSGEALMKKISEIGRGAFCSIKDISEVKGLTADKILTRLNEVILDDNESTVQILRFKDDLINGIEVLPNVLGLYNNQKKASSTVLLNALYKTEDNLEYEVPLYAYWEYGKGLVSSYASTLTGSWATKWENDEQVEKLHNNALIVNRPDISITSAYMFSHITEGLFTEIYVDAPSINNVATLNVEIRYPGSDKTESQILTFDGEKYVARIETTKLGEYQVKLEYMAGDELKSTEYLFYIPYLPEYNAFTVFDASNLYYMVSTNGHVFEDGNFTLENDESIVQKYVVEFTPICMIICGALFVIDIIVRKLNIEDIKSLFRIRRIRKEKK